MTTLRLCPVHVNELREAITCQGGGRLLLAPEVTPAPYDPEIDGMPDLLTLAIALLMMRTASTDVELGQSSQMNRGACVGCTLRNEDWFPGAASQAIEMYMINTPAVGHG